MIAFRCSPRNWWRFSTIGGLVLVAVLHACPPALAQESHPPPTDSLTAADVAFMLRYQVPASPEAPSADRWIALDKAKHLGGSALWTLSTQYVLVNKAGWSEETALPASVASGAAAGLAKELYDRSRPSEDASGRDLVADAVGIGLAAGLILL